MMEWTELFFRFTKTTVESEVRGNELIVKAGTLLSSTSRAALNEELTGFEFAGGIPGTFGGAVVMNAGAYGGEMVQVLKEVTVLTKEGETKL